MTASAKPLHVDIPVKLSVAKVVFIFLRRRLKGIFRHRFSISSSS